MLLPYADFQPNGAAPLASFGTAVKGQTYTYEGPKDFSTPKEMSKADMDAVKAEIVQAARNSLEAGACPEPLPLVVNRAISLPSVPAHVHCTATVSYIAVPCKKPLFEA